MRGAADQGERRRPGAASRRASEVDRRAVGGDSFFKTAYEKLKPSWAEIEGALVAEGLTVRAALEMLGLSRSSYYRRERSGPRAVSERHHRRALSVAERQEVLRVLNSERFWDQAPGEVYATLLDEGRYLCSERTMYRILAANQQVRERRDQLRHPYQAPELIASGPNEVWSWDITKLLKPAMKSQVLAFFLAGLGVTRTHSRPYVSNDNPYSESQFKTMKYRPEFPERFGCYQDARRFLSEFFPWYNHEHHHSGLGYLTPYEVHYGLAEKRREQRAGVLKEAYERNPQRFVRGLPQPALLPTAAWINRSKEIPATDSPEVLNPSITTIEPKKGLHNCPITHATESGKV